MRIVSGSVTRLRAFTGRFLVVGALFAGLAAAQTTTGTQTTGVGTQTAGTVPAQITSGIKGKIAGSNGAVAGAKVTITNRTTGAIQTLTSSAQGEYSSAQLDPGDYLVTVDAKGFYAARASVTVQENATATADFTLQVPSVQVNTDSATVTHTEYVDNPIERLPVNGSNFLDLGWLAPGVQNQDAGTFAASKNGFTSISIASRFGGDTRTEVDGLDINDETVGGQSLNIPGSAVQELRVMSSLPGLDTGLTSSGAVNIVTSRGWNPLHGEAFGLYRNGDIASASLPGGAGPSWAQQHFGGNLGGALIKDKLFFFVDGERNRRDLQNPVLAGSPFSARSTTVNAPFREVDTTDRLDYSPGGTVSRNVHAFYRFSYDQNSDIRPFAVGPSIPPFLSRTNTPVHALGLDLTRGDYVHSFRFEYLKYRNVISDRSSEVVGAANPLPDLTINIGGGATNRCTSGSLFCSGPSYLAPQQTYQSDIQFKYDGSYMWRSRHQVRYGVSFNRILGGGFASLYSLAPALSDPASLVLPAGVSNSDGDPTNPLNYPVEWAFLGNGQGFASEKSQFGLPGGGQHDNQLAAYLGDSWKVKKNLTVNYGVRWVRDTGRTDSDLAAIPALNAWGPSLGNRVRQPNSNFAPQLGVAWDPYSSGRTSIRGGIGLYYGDSVFRNAMVDRAMRLPQGSFLSTPAACIEGAPGRIQWPSNPGVTGTQILDSSNAVVGVANADSTVSPTWCGQSVGTAEPLAVGLEQVYQSATLAAGSGANPSFIGNANAFAGPNQNGLSLLAPNYKTPRSVQMNIGLQHEFRPGMVFSMDFLRNVTTQTLLGLDVNHGGDVNTFNIANAIADRDFAQTNALTLGGAANCPPGTGQVGCMIASFGGPAGALAAYGQAGIGAPAQVTGGAPCSFCAFPGFHPNLGVNVMNFPAGRSVYNAFDLSLKQQLANFAPGISHAYLQISYSRSRYVSQSEDSDLASLATDYSRPERFTGPSGLDRKNQFSLGGYFDVPYSLRLGLIGHFASPLPATLNFQQNAGAAEVLVTDWTGDGTTGDIVPQSSVGSYMRSIKATGLSNFISNYNTNIAGNATPAGIALVTNGVFSLNELQSIGGVMQPLAQVLQHPAGLSWLKTFDLKLSWEHKFMERITLNPGISAFNLFNLANFDLPGYTQSGTLNFGFGSISQPATALQPQGTVGGTSTNAKDPVSGRINRNSLQSGTFALGAPRAVEWSLKISF